MNDSRRAIVCLMVVALLVLSGCGFILRHTSNITAAPDVEVVKISPPLVLQPLATSHPESPDWVLVSSVTEGLIPHGRETEVFDLSPFLGLDPFAGEWVPPLPTEQRVFVPSADVDVVTADPDDWTKRYVVQLAVNKGPEVKLGTHEAGRLAVEDPARILCRTGVSRETLSDDPAQIIYQSEFTNCPRFGPDRVVLTRELFGNWDSVRHSQAIYTFSYEVRGSAMTAAQRTEGLNLIQDPQLLMAHWNGEKHPLFRDEQLRMVAAP
jgi:hypothetical protein